MYHYVLLLGTAVVISHFLNIRKTINDRLQQLKKKYKPFNYHQLVYIAGDSIIHRFHWGVNHRAHIYESRHQRINKQLWTPPA